MTKNLRHPTLGTRLWNGGLGIVIAAQGGSAVKDAIAETERGSGAHNSTRAPD